MQPPVPALMAKRLGPIKIRPPSLHMFPLTLGSPAPCSLLPCLLKAGDTPSLLLLLLLLLPDDGSPCCTTTTATYALRQTHAARSGLWIPPDLRTAVCLAAAITNTRNHAPPSPPTIPSTFTYINSHPRLFYTYNPTTIATSTRTPQPLATDTPTTPAYPIYPPVPARMATRLAPQHADPHHYTCPHLPCLRQRRTRSFPVSPLRRRVVVLHNHSSIPHLASDTRSQEWTYHLPCGSALACVPLCPAAPPINTRNPAPTPHQLPLLHTTHTNTYIQRHPRLFYTYTPIATSTCTP
jgi:hypothetical protein